MPNTDGPIELTNAAGLKEGCKPTTVPAPPAASRELSPRPQRRTFSAAAKLRILEETDRAADTGGIGLMTPHQVHYGQAEAVHAARQDVLAQAHQANPERFVRKTPVPPPMPTQTWINSPQKMENSQT